jgi:hypothetical protein
VWETWLFAEYKMVPAPALSLMLQLLVEVCTPFRVQHCRLYTVQLNLCSHPYPFYRQY